MAFRSLLKHSLLILIGVLCPKGLSMKDIYVIHHKSMGISSRAALIKKLVPQRLNSVVLLDFSPNLSFVSCILTVHYLIILTKFWQ